MKIRKLLVPPCVAAVLLCAMVPLIIDAQSASSRPLDATWSFDGASDEALRDSFARS